MDIKNYKLSYSTHSEDALKAKKFKSSIRLEITSLFDRVCVATFESHKPKRRLRYDKVKEAGGDIVGMEGEETSEWVLVDLGIYDRPHHAASDPCLLPLGRNLGWQKKSKWAQQNVVTKKLRSDDGDKPKRATRAKAPVSDARLDGDSSVGRRRRKRNQHANHALPRSLPNWLAKTSP